MTGFETYDAFRKVHLELVTEALVKGNNPRQADWTESIAVGSREFVETIKENLGLRAKGRKILESDGVNTYNANSDSNNDNIGGQNTFYWHVNHEFIDSYRGPTPIPNRFDDHMPLGVGTVDWKKAVRLLKASGYDSTITLVVFCNDPDMQYKYLDMSR